KAGIAHDQLIMPAVGPGVSLTSRSKSKILGILGDANDRRVDVVDRDRLSRHSIGQQAPGPQTDEGQFIFFPRAAEGLKEVGHWTRSVIVTERLPSPIDPVLATGRLSDQDLSRRRGCQQGRA